MIKNTGMPIAVEGLKLIIPLAIFTVLLFFFDWLIVGFILLAITMFMLFFFRDPDRAIAHVYGAVVSRGDGMVVVI